MKLLDWGFTRRRRIKARFDKYPDSLVEFRLVDHYYFVYVVEWSKNDPIVTRLDLEKMGLLMNRELGIGNGKKIFGAKKQDKGLTNRPHLEPVC